MIKVSICIPTFNQTDVLRKALDSILSQTFQDYEVIITDDSPNSNVAELIMGYEFNGRLQYYHNQEPLGSPKNWNYCISKATGEYIKILHHDDWFSYDYSLEDYVKLMDNTPHASMAFSGSVGLLEDNYSWIHSMTEEQFENLQDDPLSLYLGNKIGGPSAIIFKNGIGIQFDQNLKWLVDIDFYLKILFSGDPIIYTAAPLITTFAAPNRLTNSCSNNKTIEIFEHFFVLENLTRMVQKPGRMGIKLCYDHAIQICQSYGVTRVREIRHCGFKGRIPFPIRQQLLIQRTVVFIRRCLNRLKQMALIKIR